jgi:hypothetical protein
MFDTFVMLTEDSTDAQQNWDRCAQISSTEFLCQVCINIKGKPGKVK